MIVILYCGLQSGSEKVERSFRPLPELELLNRPYLERLADEYRDLGARDV